MCTAFRAHLPGARFKCVGPLFLGISDDLHHRSTSASAARSRYGVTSPKLAGDLSERRRGSTGGTEKRACQEAFDKLSEMRRVLVFVLAAAMTGGAGYVVAQTPAKKAPAQPAPAAAQRRVNMPPMTMPGFAPGRPIDQAKAVYEFAAQHPEVLKFVPCYCGCESTGHPHNESCFVKRRDVQGNVLEWDMHGYG